MSSLILAAFLGLSVHADGPKCSPDRISEIEDVCFEASSDELEAQCLAIELKKQCGISPRS